MKVLQVNLVYRYGSTGKIMADLHEELLGRGHGSVVCYGRRPRPAEPHVYKVSSELGGKVHSVLSRLFGVDFAFSPIATRRLLRIIRREKPDVVHLHCLNGHFVNVYRLVEYLKRNHIRTVLTLHAEIMHTAGCEHAMECDKWRTECHHCPRIRGKLSRFFRDDARYCFRRMKKAFAGFEDLTVVGVSGWLTERASQSPIFGACTYRTVHNGINTEVFSRRDATALRERLGIPEDRRVILHVTPNFYHAIKGGGYVLELAARLPECQFLIVGYNGDGSDLPENVKGIAHTQNQIELAEYYSLADCFVCTSLRESLPTVCLEAASCGCKTVAFRAAGIPESIPEGMGETVPCYDLDAFEAALRRWLPASVDPALVTAANEANRREGMLERYMQLYMEEVQG